MDHFYSYISPGLHTAVSASAPAAAQAAAVQHGVYGRQLREGRWLQGHHLLRRTLSRGPRQRLPQAQHDRARRRPVRRHARRRQAALHVLQLSLLQLLRWRARRAHGAGLGADALRDGRRVRHLRGGHDGRAHQPRLRRRVLPEQAPAGQHLHSYCKGKWQSTITCTVF
jgi:hypothetical protein